MTHTSKSNESLVVRVVRRVGRLVSNAIRHYKIAFEIPVKYHYNDFSIILPANHMLPNYRQLFPKYDRFLPHLAKYFGAGDTIIDVGANVGDTLAGMVEFNSKSSYICIEADETFFNYLIDNIDRIKQSKGNLSVIAIKSLVGQSVSNVSLQGIGGTKHAVISKEGGIQSKPLDVLLKDQLIGKIRLLKSDVDGFDYDIIDSGMSILSSQMPIIFFECQFDHAFQKAGYVATLHKLESIGYSDWTLFDNFGEVVLRTEKVSNFLDLLEYVWKQNIGVASRTIHYYDMLAATSADKDLIDTALRQYS